MSRPSLVEVCRSIDPEPIAELTLELARMWSPPGHERAIGERVAQELAGVGARVQIDRAFPESPSVIAELGPKDGPTLQWHGHLDAVDVAHEPPARAGDLLVGRGTADMKGPVAAMIAAAQLLERHGCPGRVLITFHGMHESGGNEPLHDLIRRGIHGDAVITGELGGGVDLPIAGLGLSFWEIGVTGPPNGLHEAVATADTVDPVEVGRLLHGELAALRDELCGAHAVEPRPSLFVGRFVAGDYVNRIPATASLSGTRRHDDTMTPDEVRAELDGLVERVRERTGAPISLDVIAVADSFAVAPHERIVSAVQRAHHDLTGDELPTVRAKIATNAVHFVREAGIPAVGYGPDPASNHSDHEQIKVSELGRLAAGFALSTVRYFETADDPA